MSAHALTGIRLLPARALMAGGVELATKPAGQVALSVDPALPATTVALEIRSSRATEQLYEPYCPWYTAGLECS
jgi:hypothetical protein